MDILSPVNPTSGHATAPRLAPKATSWVFAEDFVHEPEPVREARATAVALGIVSLSRGAAAALSFLCRAIGARAVVEIGTGAGVSGLACFAGMPSDGILTSIDVEQERQQAARQAFLANGIPTQRFRLITGSALGVLPKLTDAAYDLVFIDADILEYVEYVAQAQRLLRPGGMVVLHHALLGGAVADPANEDDETVIMREALQACVDIDEFHPVLLPVGDGLLAAVRD